VRDKLLHFYFAVDLDLVWRMATDALPVLITGVEQQLAAAGLTIA
jgi:uncharacterized protein with HEPN domain